jgi:membrane-bound lytic murein transglycosylase D
MRFRKHAVLVAAFLVSGITGCAVTQSNKTDAYMWAQRSDTWTELRPVLPSQDHAGYFGSHLSGSDSARSGNFDFSHPRVEDFLLEFQTRWRDSFSVALSRGGRYLPSMTSIIQKEGLPIELVYLPIIESGFRTDAVSHAGAVGPWQFIPGTGRRYGLRIDQYVDERRDPIKSTRAAARYLKDLYDMFGDWHLSLAAYNTGENNISRILERGDAEDYWEMSERGFLCRETRDYVPKFLAALQMAEQPEAFGFEPPYPQPMRYDVVQIDRSLPLSTVARLSAASTEEIKDLNPALHRGVTPPQPYSVRLPKGSKETFQVAYAVLDQELREEGVRQRGTRRARARSGGTRKHKVRRGETIASIADRYDIAPRALMIANGIRNPNKIQTGQTLNIPVAAAQSPAEVIASRPRGGGRMVD